MCNEAGTLSSVLRAVESALLPGIGKEIVVVDYGSTDGTRVLLRHEAGSGCIRAMYHERNRGKGASLRTVCREVTGDFVLVRDADLEYDPREDPRFLRPILEGKAEVVYGSCFLGGEEKRVLFFWHYAGNRFPTTLSHMFTNRNLTDMETCYKVFRKEILDRIQIEEDRFGFEPEITAKIAKIRCRIHEVGVSHHGRTYSDGKKITWKDDISALRTILKNNLFR